MRKYIFFTYPLNQIGGTQMVVAGKAQYLEKHGWEVYIFTRGNPYGKSQIPSLTKYIAGCGFNELYNCPYKVSDLDRDELLDKMVAILRIDKTIENEIIIESHYDVVAYWAELLAERIHAHHFAMILNPSFRDDWNYYFENLDFFYFKYLRRELFALDQLFNGYRNLKLLPYDDLPNEISWGCEQDPIQDVQNPNVNAVCDEKNSDYTIAYIGRPEKSYLQSIFYGIVNFANKYPHKKFRLIMVGNFADLNQFSMFAGIGNVNIVLLGVLVPIPKKLFQCVDVVIAGDQTAMFCAEENVPVITSIVKSDKTAGVLFYDTEDSWHGENGLRISYEEALEKVLIRREYANRKPNIPKRRPADWHYEQLLNWQLKNQSPLRYFTKKFKTDLRRDWVAIFPFRLVERGERVVFYGVGDICNDYQKQIEDYCQLVAIVADEYEHYDRTVLPPEKLAELEYDNIVISRLVDRQQLDKIVAKVMKIVGEVNIICDFKLISI